MKQVYSIISEYVRTLTLGVPVFIHRSPQSNRPDNHLLIRLDDGNINSEFDYDGSIDKKIVRETQAQIEFKFYSKVLSSNDQFVALEAADRLKTELDRPEAISVGENKVTFSLTGYAITYNDDEDIVTVKAIAFIQELTNG